MWQTFLDLKITNLWFFHVKNISLSKNYKPLISWISWHSLHLHHTPLRGSGGFSFNFFFQIRISNISNIPNISNISNIPNTKHKYFRNICPTLHWEALWGIQLSSKSSNHADEASIVCMISYFSLIVSNFIKEFCW